MFDKYISHTIVKIYERIQFMKTVTYTVQI